MKRKHDKPMYLFINSDMAKWIQDQAAKTGKSKSEVVREAITKQMEYGND